MTKSGSRTGIIPYGGGDGHSSAEVYVRAFVCATSVFSVSSVFSHVSVIVSFKQISNVLGLTWMKNCKELQKWKRKRREHGRPENTEDQRTCGTSGPENTENTEDQRTCGTGGPADLWTREHGKKSGDHGTKLKKKRKFRLLKTSSELHIGKR